MKKLFTLLLAAVMVISFVGCSTKNEAASNANTNNAPAAAEDWKSKLGSKDSIRVGISPDYAPYESYDEAGKIVGFDVELVKFMSDYLGVEYELVPMDFQTIISTMNAGTVDIGVSCFSYKPERDCLFSDTYYTSGQVVIVSAESGIKEIAELENSTIAAGVDTTALDAANALAEKFKNIKVQAGTNEVMFQSMKAGAIKGIVIDKIVGQRWVDNSNGELVMLGETLSEEETQVVVKNGNELILNKINEAIKAYKETDTYKENINKYFGEVQ